MGAVQFSNAIYLSITDGKLSRRVKEPTATSKERTTKENKVVHEEFFQAWKGRITNITTKENDYGKQWLVTIEDEDGEAILQMPYSSGYSAAFLKTLPNVNFKEEVVIVPKLTVEGDKKKTTLFINQNGSALKWYYTKDNPQGLPELKQIKVKGKVTWDDSDIMEFLENMVNTKILPKLSGAKATPATPAAKPSAATAQTDDEDFVPGADEEDETPF